MSKKNSNVLNLKKIIFENKKNSEVYSAFKKNILFLKNKKFVVGVSGGPDSLALVALCRLHQEETKTRVYFVLVDHGIRKNSKKESLSVKKLLKRKNISLNVIRNDRKINTNIQAKAREVRYRLLSKFCFTKDLKYILTAHHSDDQIETFLIRLSRGSGVQGLSSMKMITKTNMNLRIVRPLLNIKKKELVYLAKKTFGKIFYDPSNRNIKYLRTKIRKLKKSFEKSGIHHDQIIKSINNLASSNTTLNNYIDKIYKINVKKENKNICIDLKNLFLETNEIQIKIISKSIKNFSNSYYPPRSKKILNLINELKAKKQKKFTLGGCIIERSNKSIIIKKEAKN
jgi:tRNA(Ile)-lysidine synthase|tara:strand:+ start:163 stop:1188 length:1026 start_codon:yes stop_codon:yes gene_type:complete